MGKPSNFSILADELAAIRGELADLKARYAQPTQGELRARAVNDKEHPDPTPVEIPGDRVDQVQTIQQMIAEYVGSALAVERGEDLGTFEEEDDFTEDDHDELDMSGFEVHEYEMDDDPGMPEPFTVDPDDPSQGHIPPEEPPADVTVPAVAAEPSPVNPPD